MKKEFSNKWNKSKQPRKQRKYRHNAPLHILGKFLNSHLSKDLRKKYERRSIRIRKGDKIKVVRGQFKGKIGKVEKVMIRRLKIFVEGVQYSKRDGSKSNYPIDPSNVIITELDLSDKFRKEKLEKKNASQKIKSA